MAVDIAELQAMTTEELEKLLAQEQESLRVLEGVRNERDAQIEIHRRAIRLLEDAIFNSIPRQAEVRVHILMVQELLKSRRERS